jgi:hypothetical protein
MGMIVIAVQTRARASRANPVKLVGIVWGEGPTTWSPSTRLP